MWFQRLGGNYQLILETPEDLKHLWALDEARWIASSAPVAALNCDPVFLSWLDSDGNDRVRVDELKLGARWMLALLRDRSGVGGEKLRLAAIDDSRPEGRQLQASARQILANLGRGDAAEIGLAEVRDRKQIMAAGVTNGDGVIPPGAVDDLETRGFVQAILDTLGGEEDASGRRGVTEALATQFSSEATAWLDWRAAGQAWGDAEAAAWAAHQAIAAKLDAWFALCQVASFDERVLDATRLEAIEPAALTALALADADALQDRLREAPLARPNPDGRLQLDGWINPAWVGALASLRAAAFPDTTALTATDWAAVTARLAPYGRWLDAKPETGVGDLGEPALRELVAPRHRDALNELIALDREVGDEIARIADVEKLLLYQRWLLEFANNFVNFSRFYDPDARSMLEMGTLVMDGRDFKLTVRVQDVAAHKQRAKDGMIYLLYVQVVEASGAPEMTVAAAVTSTDRGSLYVGKRGIFFTTDGAVRDAVVVDILENPISVAEAIKLPFKRLAVFLTAQIERLNAKQYEALENRVGQGFDETTSELVQAPTELPEPTPAEPAPPAPTELPPADDGVSTRALLVNGGIAVAALSSALAYIANTLASIDITQLLVALAVLVGLATVPAVIVAMIRLSQRDLGVVLEASGWAINHELRLPRWAGPVFTRTPPLPRGASRRRPEVLRAFLAQVEYESDRRAPWLVAAGVFAIFFLLAAWRFGAIG